MTRARLVAVTTITACALVGQRASAGINFIGGALTNVAPKPEFVLAGDLENNGLTDVVVISPMSREVDVFTAAPGTPSYFAPVHAVHFGTTLRNGALGDLNGDGRLDLVVTDSSSNIVWILLGRGDGTFADPYQVGVPQTLSPSAIAIGNFDDCGHPDLAVSDDRLGRVFILVNDNGNPPRFHDAGSVAVGAEPEQIISADVNGDGKPDILTLDLGGPRVKNVSVVLWKRVVMGFPEFQTDIQYTAGARPSEMLVADFTNDGLPDIAMINQTATGGEIDVLVNQGNGVFVPPVTTKVPCPFLTFWPSCRLFTLAAGDFDGNGFIDLMVGMLDPRGTAGGVAGTISDAMQAFGGRGDGFFIPGGVFTIQRAPVAMVSGAFTALGHVDLAVADRSTFTLQAFANVGEGSGEEVGVLCERADECLSSHCTDGLCCATECAADEKCNASGHAGICVPMRPTPVACTLPAAPECTSTQFCVDGFCCDEPCVGGRCDRTIGGVSYAGVCILGTPAGGPCSGDNLECATNFCSGNFVCCFDACLGTDQFCDNTGVCHTKGAPGDPCDDPVDTPESQECQSGVCDDLTPNELQPICCSRQCNPTTEKCFEGSCVNINFTPPPTATATASPTPRQTPGGLGTSCFFQTDCAIGQCTDFVCCNVSEGLCPPNQRCMPPDGRCRDVPTPTPTATPGPSTPTPNPCDECPRGVSCVVTSVGPICGEPPLHAAGGCSTTGDATADGNLAAVAVLLLALRARHRLYRG